MVGVIVLANVKPMGGLRGRNHWHVQFIGLSVQFLKVVYRMHVVSTLGDEMFRVDDVGEDAVDLMAEVFQIFRQCFKECLVHKAEIQQHVMAYKHRLPPFQLLLTVF